MAARSIQLGYVQQRVAEGEYRVDATRVAAAMLERIGALALDRQLSGEGGRGRRSEPADRRGS